MSRSVVWSALLLLVLACAAPARAGVILSVSGDAALVSPSAGTNLNNNKFGSTDTAFAFNERGHVGLSGFAVDVLTSALSPGAVNARVSTTPNLYSGVVDSHLLHFDQRSGNGLQSATGSVTFSSEIVGLLWTGDGLNDSDATFGLDGVTYPSGSGANHRWLENNDRLTISADRMTLTFDWRITGAFDQVRVLTAANPAPPALALLAAAGGTLGLARVLRRRR